MSALIIKNQLNLAGKKIPQNKIFFNQTLPNVDQVKKYK